MIHYKLYVNVYDDNDKRPATLEIEGDVQTREQAVDDVKYIINNLPRNDRLNSEKK